MKKVTLIFAMVIANFTFAQLTNPDLLIDPSPWDGSKGGWTGRGSTTALEWESGKLIIDGLNAGGTGVDLGLAHGLASDPFDVTADALIKVTADVTTTGGGEKASLRLVRVGGIGARGGTPNTIETSATLVTGDYTVVEADVTAKMQLLLFYGKKDNTEGKISYSNIQVTLDGVPLSKISYDLDKLESPVVAVYNTVGAKVGSSKADTENLPNGLYIVQFENGATRKISIIE